METFINKMYPIKQIYLLSLIVFSVFFVKSELFSAGKSDEKKARIQARKESKRLIEDPIQLPIDWDSQAIKAETDRYIKDKKTTVNRFIRKTLSSKAKQVAPDPNEQELFSSPIQAYKKMFEPFNQEYARNLQSYLKVLHDSEALDQTSYMQRQALLSLQNISVPEYKNTELKAKINSIKLPSDQATPFPFLNMHHGSCEMLGEENVINNRLEKQAPAFACSAGTLKVFQNYHEIVCLENNELIWRYILPDNFPDTHSKSDIKSKVVFGRTYPVIDNGQVYARLMKDGNMTLFCFDAQTGKVKWILNSKDYETCSGIALWRDQIVLLIKEYDAIARFYLLQINKESGKITSKTFVFSADSSLRIGKRSARIRTDLFTPAPLIINNEAYITTNIGLVISYDLLTNSFKWIRKYKKASFFDERKLIRIAHRNSSSPISGGKNILFQPFNSDSLILLNKATGKIVANLTINWQEVIPSGGKVIVIDDKGMAAFHSLKDLKKQDPLPGKNYRLVQKLDDGNILQTEKKLVIYDLKGKLKKSMTMPKNTLATFADHDSLFSYNSKNKTRSVIEKFLLKQPATVLNSKPEKILPAMYSIEFKKLGNDSYIISNGAFIRVNPDASIKWICPIPRSSNGIKIYSGGKFIYLFVKNRLFCLDNENGEIKNFFPNYGELLLPLEAENVYPQGAVFLNGGLLRKFTPDKAESLGTFKGNKCIANFENGTLIATLDKSGTVTFIRKNPQTGTYSTETVSRKLKNNSRLNIRKIINDQKVVLLSLKYMLVVNANKSTKEIELIQGRRKTYKRGLEGKNFVSDGNFCFFKNYAEIVNIVDLKKNKDLGEIPGFTNIPVLIDGKIIGIAKSDIVCFDSKTEKIVYRLKNFTNNKGQSKRNDINRYATTFKLRNKVALFFPGPLKGSNRKNSEEGALMLISPDKPDFKITSFPGGNNDSTCMNTGDGWLISLPEENRVVRLSQKTMDSLKEKSPNFYPQANTPIEFTIDGYPDEWDLGKFHNINNNLFNARILDKKYVILAIELNNRDAINKLGSSGFDGRYKIMMSSGAIAGLRTNNIIKNGKNILVSLYSNLQSSKEKDITIAYSVKPDGSSCFIEIKVPINKIITSSFFKHLKKESRNRRGDIAFDIIYTDKLNEKHALLSESDIPALYPRAFFPDASNHK